MNSLSIREQIRKTIQLHREFSEKEKGGSRYYRVDRVSASYYFFMSKKWEERVSNHLGKLCSQKRPAIHIDICGEANATNLGATKSYCFYLGRNNATEKATERNGHIYFNGDLFNSDEFLEFIELVKKGGIPPALITFNPMAGLQEHGPEREVEGVPKYKEITYRILGKRLEQMIKILMPGGYILLENPFQFDADAFCEWYTKVPIHKWTLVVNVRKVARKMKCKTEVCRDINGTYFLIQKN